MAAKKKYLRILLLGTGLNEQLIAASHEVIAYPSSTYHKFTYPNGISCWKNDFGVSMITVIPIELTEAEALAMMDSNSRKY